MTSVDEVEGLKGRVRSALHESEAELTRLSHDIHAHPELRFEEHQASAWAVRDRLLRRERLTR
jgi:metal-dependent amidase/aminoacylase/carboxypeptidase family protein